MKFSVIVTLGPSTLHEDVLRAIDPLGPCIYRINGAHSSKENVRDTVQFVRGALPDCRFLIDLPGNKIRTKNLNKGLPVQKGKTFSISPGQLNFKDFYNYVKPGDKVLAHDGIYEFEVKGVKDSTVEFISHCDGELKNNKGLHISGVNDTLPFVFEKDRELIDVACECGIPYIGVSYVRTAEDVKEIKRIMADAGHSDMELIVKVETQSAVKNLGYIFLEAETILIDRGDLAADVGIFNLPVVQERVIQSAKRAQKKVFLATQFLKNMEMYPIPLIAEIVALHDTIRTGIHGIQLSDEAAVGKYPLQCVDTVFRVYNNSFSG